MGFCLFILVLAASSAIVSFAMAAIIRSNVLCVIASAITTEMLLDLFFVTKGMNPKYPDISLLAVTMTAMIGTPVIIVSSIFSVFLAKRLYRKRAAGPKT
jgi:hypothetical protein